MTEYFLIPPELRQILDGMRPDRNNIYRAWCYGRLYGREESRESIINLPSVFGVADDETMTFDGPKIEAVGPDRGDAA